MSEAEKNTKTEETSNETGSAVSLNCVFGIKAGMTRVFTESGESVPVTVLDLNHDTVVTQVKKKDKHGYSAVQLGFKEKKQQRTNKSERGHFKKSGAPGFYYVDELRLDDDLDVNPGEKSSLDFLEPGLKIDINGKIKGKGFQGVMKRWGFHGAPDSHGHSLNHRMGGSIGQHTDPGRVFPGKKMSGQMGNVNKTVQNLKVVEFDKENKLLLVKGAVPGSKNWAVKITVSKKQPKPKVVK